MIVRHLGDHTDSTTYYVQAVIRNSVTGVILKTVQLTNGGNGRFTKLYEVPADVSGEGFYIDMTVSVYSDSGYTTKASAYSDRNDQYLVWDRNTAKGGGGGGIDVDYKKIEAIITKMVKPLIDRKELNLGPVLSKIEGVISAVSAIEIPKSATFNYGIILKGITAIEKSILTAIKNKEVTPKTELNGVLDTLRKLELSVMDKISKESSSVNLEKVFSKFEEVHKMIKELADDVDQRESAKDRMVELRKALQPLLGDEPLPSKVKPVNRASLLFGKK